MSETNFQPVRIEGNKTIVEGSPKESKEAFFQAMEEKVRVLDKDGYEQAVGRDSAMGHFDAVIFQIPKGKMAKDAIIYVNRDDFVVDGEDYTDCIPIAVRHEMYELWTYAKTGYSLSPPPESIGIEKRIPIGHGLALREEYRFAFEQGKADRYLEFIRKYAEKLPKKEAQARILENEEAYKKAKRRLERK